MEPYVESMADAVGSFWPARPASPLPAVRTYVVMGCPHGGTTMLAGLLRLAGVPMGTRIDTVTSEDLEFRQYEPAALREVIRRRNLEHDVWGWKAPWSVQYLPELLPELREPFFVFVTRDPVATTRREVRETGCDELAALDAWLANMRTQVDILRATGRPTLLISYEKTVRRPERLLDLLAVFLGETWSDEQRARLAQFVVPLGGYQTVNRHFALGLRPMPAALAHPEVLAGEPPEPALLWRTLAFDRPYDLAWREHVWDLHGVDPWCHVIDDELLYLTGTHWFQLRLDLAPGQTVRPRFYLDIGDAYNPEHVIILPELGAGVWSFRLHLPPPLCGLRLDPHDQGGISLNGLELRVAPVASSLRPPRRVTHALQQPEVVAGPPPHDDNLVWRELILHDTHAITRADGAWQLTSFDAYGFVHENEIPGFVGVHWLQLQLTLADGQKVRPKFYFDIGDSFHEAHTINLPELGTGVWSFRVELPHSQGALRFDPDDQPGTIPGLIVRTTAPVPTRPTPTLTPPVPAELAAVPTEAQSGVGVHPAVS